MTKSSRVAYVDESRRSNRYLLAYALVEVRHANAIRRELRSLVVPPKRRIHFGSEVAPRRRSLLALFDEMPIEVHVRGAVIGQHQREHEIRSQLLGALVPQLQDLTVARLVIESRDGRDDDDKIAIHRSRRPSPALPYEHQTPADEPLLWLPDAYAWAAGRAPEWTRLLPKTLRP